MRAFAASVAVVLAAIPSTVSAQALDLSAMSAEIDAGKYRKIEAIRVIRNGQTVFEGDYRGNTPESRIDARSSGKSITAIAIGMAIDDGKLASVDLPVFGFFKDREPFAHDGPAKRAITIRDLLTMSSALDCDDWTDASPGNEERMYETRDWTRFALDIPIAKDYARGAGGLGRYSYCTAGAFLLGRIVERATGERFDTYVQRRLFDPLGITGAQWKTSPNGEVQSGGQLSLRARFRGDRAVDPGRRHEGWKANHLPRLAARDADRPRQGDAARRLWLSVVGSRLSRAGQSPPLAGILHVGQRRQQGGAVPGPQDGRRDPEHQL